MTPLEKDIEKHLTRAVGRAGGLCLKWVCPGNSGVPDRLVLVPGGRVVFCELKRPTGGRVAPLQKWWAAKLRGLGFRHYYLYTHEDVSNFVAEVLSSPGGLRARSVVCDYWPEAEKEAGV